MKRTLFILLCIIALCYALVTRCSGGGESTQSAADTLTRRQKDSLVAEMPIPGARAVGNAIRAADSIAARAQRHDTIR